jgi:cyanophycin synthetase
MFLHGRPGPGRPAHALDRVSATAQYARSAVTAKISRADRGWRSARASFYEELWSAAAADVGAVVTPRGGGELELSRGDRSIRVRETRCSIESREALERAGDKVLVARLLADAGLPSPPHQVVTLATLADAREFLASTPGPYVVKPAEYTGGGQGVTTNVRTWAELRRAAAAAAAAGARAARTGRAGGALQRLQAKLGAVATVPLLVQRQVPGVNFRLLYLDGVLIDAVRREAPSVVGDGLRTVGALIEAANNARSATGDGRGELMIHRDLALEQTLTAQGLRWTTVPVSGRVVELKTTINENSRVSNLPAAHELGDELVEDGRRAAEVLGVRLAGVDILTDNPSESLTAAGGCVLEVNTTPGLAMHYHGHPGQVPVATEVLRRLLDPAAQPRAS